MFFLVPFLAVIKNAVKEIYLYNINYFIIGMIKLRDDDWLTGVQLFVQQYENY